MDKFDYFYFDELNDDGRVHINLSEEAWFIIKQDEENFWDNDKKITDSGFLNRILTNFYQSANASLNIRYIEKKNYLDKLIKDNDDVKTLLLKDYINNLKANNNYPKGKAFKLKLNKDNIELINNLTEAREYDGVLGKYLKALFEEYAKLPTFIREQIYFKETVDNFNVALLNQKQVRLTIQILNKTKNEIKKQDKKYYLLPYKLVQDETRNYNYLLGYAYEMDKTNNPTEVKIISYRLSRIKRSDVMLSLSGFISKDHKEKIEAVAKEKGIQFLVGDLLDVKVKFSVLGLDLFKKQIYMRPSNYQKLDEYTYIFKCTKRQAINYFFKLGKDIEILEPQSLREYFINSYKGALNKYKED